VGGGISGLSTALSICGKMDATILLIEKGEIGDSSKTSPFTFPDVIKQFNLSDAVLQKYTRFTYKSPTGVSASFEYEIPAFVTINYQKMCNILLNRVRKAGSVTVLDNVAALDLEETRTLFSTESLKLTLSNSDKISCDILVDASGSSFFAATKLGLKLPALYSHPFGEFLEACKIEDPTELCIFTGNKYGNGGGWFYPIDGRTARFGFAAITKSRTFPKDVVENNLKKAIHDFYPYNEMLMGSKCKRTEFGTIPIGSLQRFVWGRILIVGDAAGQATPWYQEGIRPALEGGQLCGETIVEAYKRGSFRRKFLMKYQHIWDDKNKQSYAYAKERATSYFRNQEQWDNSVRYQASLTPREMMGIIRYCHFPRMRSSVSSRNFHSSGFAKIFRETILKIHGKIKR